LDERIIRDVSDAVAADNVSMEFHLLLIKMVASIVLMIITSKYFNFFKMLPQMHKIYLVII